MNRRSFFQVFAGLFTLPWARKAVAAAPADGHMERITEAFIKGEVALDLSDPGLLVRTFYEGDRPSRSVTYRWNEDGTRTEISDIDHAPSGAGGSRTEVIVLDLEEAGDVHRGAHLPNYPVDRLLSVDVACADIEKAEAFARAKLAETRRT